MRISSASSPHQPPVLQLRHCSQTENGFILTPVELISYLAGSGLPQSGGKSWPGCSIDFAGLMADEV